MFPSSLYVYDTRPCHWSFMEGHHDNWSTCLSCNYHVREYIPPRTTLHFVFCSLGLRFEPLIAICSSLDYSCSRPRPKAQYMSWALIPTVSYKKDLISYSLII